jgi:hypothetical protein
VRECSVFNVMHSFIKLEDNKDVWDRHHECHSCEHHHSIGVWTSD